MTGGIELPKQEKIRSLGECNKLVQKECKTKPNWVEKIIYRKFEIKFKFYQTN